jgi:hypothetical protein
MDRICVVVPEGEGQRYVDMMGQLGYKFTGFAPRLCQIRKLFGDADGRLSYSGSPHYVPEYLDYAEVTLREVLRVEAVPVPKRETIKVGDKVYYADDVAARLASLPEADDA